jgi:FG-GAP-like repeat/Domain of unknown function (DUF4214)
MSQLLYALRRRLGALALTIGAIGGLAAPTVSAQISFSPPTTLSAANQAISVAIGDFNGDGKKDLFAVRASGNGVGVWLGNGDGTFGLPTDYTTAGAFPVSIAVADLDGDGKDDFVYSDGATLGVRVRLTGPATTTYYTTAPNSLQSPGKVVLADMNGDGKLDIVVVCQMDYLPGNAGGVQIYYNNSTGGFTNTQWLAVSIDDPRYLDVADVDGDGRNDIVVAGNSAGGGLQMLTNNGGGAFGTTIFNTASIPLIFGLTLADINGDGKPDLVVLYGGNSSSPTFGVALNTGTIFGTFADSTVIGNGIQAIITADFDGDGKRDLAMTDGNGNIGLRVFRGDGTGAAGFTPVTVTTPFGLRTQFALAVGDLNGDGRPDVVVTDISLGGLLGVYLQPSPAPTNHALTFGPIPLKNLGDAPFTLLASSNLGQPISYSTTTPAVCTINMQNVITLLSGGAVCTIVAQSLNNPGVPDATATASIPVRTTQTLSFAPLPDVLVSAAPFTLMSTTAADPQLTRFTSLTPGVCVVSPRVFTPIGFVPGKLLSVIAAGTCTLQATHDGGSLFFPATPVTQSFNVLGLAQNISFGPLADRLLSSGPVTASATGGASGNVVAFSSQSTNTCTVSGATVNLLAVGNCTIAANQAGNAIYAAAPTVMRTFAITAPLPPPPPGCDATIASGDCDGDGIPNGAESLLGTNPHIKDNNLFADSALGLRLFVMQQYRDFLGREGDTAGVDFWLGEIGQGRRTRTALVEEYLFSREFGGNVAPVVRMNLLSRNGAIVDYTALTNQLAQLRGIQAVPQATTLLAIANGLVSSSEYQARYGSLSGDALINALYQDRLGRSATVSELTAARVASTPGALILLLAGNAAFAEALTGRVNVTMLYVGMLRRAPDVSGYNFWVNEAAQGRSVRGLIDQFIAAAEYRTRFLPL